MTRYHGEPYDGSDDEANDMMRAAQKSASPTPDKCGTRNPKEKNMTVNVVLTDLVGKDLAGFKIVKMTEAFDIDDDGRKTTSIGYFKDPDVAKAFIGPRATNSHKDVNDVFVLTDGNVGLVINTNDVVRLVDDEVALLAIKERAVAKLTLEERKVLGLG